MHAQQDAQVFVCVCVCLCACVCACACVCETLCAFACLCESVCAKQAQMVPPRPKSIPLTGCCFAQNLAVTAMSNFSINYVCVCVCVCCTLQTCLQHTSYCYE
jgi:hypothetical protein